MPWIKKHFEKILLVIFALTLLGSAIYIYLDSQTFLAEYSHRNAQQPPNNTLPSFPIQDIDQGFANIKNPPVWTLHADHSLFVSRPYVLREGKLLDVLDGQEKLHPPVENAWIFKYNLDWADENLLNTDPDNDGFNVLEEWMAKTDPTDPKSIPPYFTKLRLKQYIRIPFRLKFNGTPDDGLTFTINTVDRKGHTQFLKIGDMIAESPFKLLSYTPKTRDKDGIPYDESELLLENTENHEKVTLINGKIVDSPTSKGKFTYLMDGSEFEVKKGDSFTLSIEPNVHYKLVDVNDNQAVIQNTQTGDEHTIPPLQPH
ncbi:MAG: Amuc_1099 family pilus-like system protein [Chthoniobacterales bacterium]